MSRNQINGPVGVEVPPIKRLPRFTVSPYFLKEVEMKISTESLHLPTKLLPKMEASLKSPVSQTPESPRGRSDAPLSPESPNKNRHSLRSLGPLHETTSPRRSPPLSSAFKTFHAPKANQIYTVPVVRTFDPTRIDTLIATLAEKLINIRARSDIIASNINYTSKLIREINILDGRS